MSSTELSAAYEALKSEAVRLAGGLTDLAQRATVYHHLYRASGGNHAFPLIAAHGALWAGGYFKRCLALGKWLAWQYPTDVQVRRQKLAQLDDFANVFRDINRRVCIDTYVNFHFSARFGGDSQIADFVPAPLLEAQNRLHAARTAKRRLSDADMRGVFETHFLHEQQHVVGPALEAAVAAFDWKLVRAMALRPLVRFAYFPGRPFWFHNFADRQERIEKGLRAFDLAAEAGWDAVEDALRSYDLLPQRFFNAPVEYFAELRAALLATAV